MARTAKRRGSKCRNCGGPVIKGRENQCFHWVKVDGNPLQIWHCHGPTCNGLTTQQQIDAYREACAAEERTARKKADRRRAANRPWTCLVCRCVNSRFRICTNCDRPKGYWKCPGDHHPDVIHSSRVAVCSKNAYKLGRFVQCGNTRPTA